MMLRSERLTRAMGNPEFTAAMERAALAFVKYRSLLPTIPYAYTRTHLIETPHYEIVAMQWAAGSVSPIHDHGDSRCWVLLLEGTLDVHNFERQDDGSGDVAMRDTGTFTLKAGDVDARYGPAELHRVVNSSTESAFSLQLYANPILSYNVFDEHARTSRSVAAVCDLRLDLGSLAG